MSGRKKLKQWSNVFESLKNQGYNDDIILKKRSNILVGGGRIAKFFGKIFKMEG